MAKRRGRPPGTSGRAAVLSASQVRHVFRVARSRSRHAGRAEAALAMTLGLGLRAKELTSLQWADVYDGAASGRYYTCARRTRRARLFGFGRLGLKNCPFAKP
jgi:integrase